ncbi:unnamed protein product, partial [Ascophyllum nodosum]
DCDDLVETNDEGRVVKLILQGFGIKGTVPSDLGTVLSALGNLSAMENLNLS